MAGSALQRSFTRHYPQFRAEDLFALVADIESYPAFVPGCRKTRVLSRRDAVWSVENVFGFGPLRQAFISRAIVNPPHELSIDSEDGPWRQFRINWRFEPAGAGCLLSCEISLAFSSSFLIAAAPFVVVDVEKFILQAFERRAERLYGRNAGEWSRRS